MNTSRLASIKLDLNLTKPAEEAAYNKLKDLPTAYDRKQLIVTSVNSCEIEDITKPSLLLKFNTYVVIRTLMFVVALVLVLLSTYFTYNFNSLAMPAFWALLLSASVVLFTSFAFTLASYSSRRMKVVLYILWVIGVSYSVFTALAGQYNQFRVYNSKETTSDSSSEIELIQGQVDENTRQIDILLDLQAPYVSLIQDLSSSPEKKVEYPQTWRDAVNNSKYYQGRIDDLQRANKELNQRLFTLMQDQNGLVENKTIYTWLSEVVGLPSAALQFLVMVFPSVFIDLVSSVLMKFSLGKRIQA